MTTPAIISVAITGSQPTKLIVHNGATGLWGNVSWGGELLENTLSENQGEYDSEFTINAGCYYDKVWTPMLMTESVDNFISASRQVGIWMTSLQSALRTNEPPSKTSSSCPPNWFR